MASDTAANMFSDQKSTSVSGGKKDSAPSVPSATADSSSGFTRRAAGATGKAIPGRRPKHTVDSRLFPGIDVRRGLANMAKGEMVEESVMSKSEAGEVTARILKAWGIYSGADEGVIMGVMEQLYFSCAINGTSVAQAGRAKLLVSGQVFEMKIVVEMLGEDYRRWARANADMIRAACQRVIADYDPYDEISSERYNSLKRVALVRGMQRMPHLAFDVADYCDGLTLPESVAVAQSKALVLSSGVNTVDAVLATGRAQTIDGFASGIGSEAHGDVGGKNAPTRRG